MRNDLYNLEKGGKCLSKIAEVKDYFLRLVSAVHLFPEGKSESDCKNLSQCFYNILIYFIIKILIRGFKMNLFEKIYFTVFIITGSMFIIGSILNILSYGELYLPILLWPTAVCAVLTIIYFIVYAILKAWGIAIPFFDAI
jgi:hypothetical protein